MDSLPENIRAKISPPASASSPLRTSPYGPRWASQYKAPTWEWVLLYGPSTVLIGLLVLSAMGSSGNPGVIVVALLFNFTIVIPALWRIPQERRRSLERSWGMDPQFNAYVWSDPSGEWSYSPVQSTGVMTLLRLMVAAAMPASWGIAIALADSGNEWPYVFLALGIGALVYLHRHLPTTFRPAESGRVCSSCGSVWPASSPRVCRRCGRVTETFDHPAIPSLRRRLSVL